MKVAQIMSEMFTDLFFDKSITIQTKLIVIHRCRYVF